MLPTLEMFGAFIFVMQYVSKHLLRKLITGNMIQSIYPITQMIWPEAQMFIDYVTCLIIFKLIDFINRY